MTDVITYIAVLTVKSERLKVVMDTKLRLLWCNNPYFQGEQLNSKGSISMHNSTAKAVLSPNSRMFSFVLRMCQCILTSASGCQQRVC